MTNKIILLVRCFLIAASIICLQTRETAQAVNTNTVFYLAGHGNFSPSQKMVYKTVGGESLKLHVFDPEGLKSGDHVPCVLVIHGGGWRSGTAESFYPFAAHFARLGLVGISLEYRLLKNDSSVTPYDCVQDARSAVRYVRAHAAELGIDPHKVIVSGGSAGGHLAACTAFCEGIDERGEDTSISCVPNALVLYWPVVDMSPHGAEITKFGEIWKEISPLNLVRPGMPPTLVFQGLADRLVPPKGAQAFHEAMLQAGNRCELVVQPGAGHGYMMYNLKLFHEGMDRTDEFLKSLGYLSN